MKRLFFFLIILLSTQMNAQQSALTPELLWKLGRVSFISQSPDLEKIIYQVTTYNLASEKATKKKYIHNLKTNNTLEAASLNEYSIIQWDQNGLYATKDEVLFKSMDEGKNWTKITDRIKDADGLKISPDGNWIAYHKPVMISKTLAKDKYPELEKSSAKIYTDLNYRHWDTYSDGTYNHIFIIHAFNANIPPVDILKDQSYHSPQQPFGGTEDYLFSKDSKDLIYICKKKTGKDYATSTNTDIYAYNIERMTTINLSEGMMGYDLHPILSPDGSKLAWLSMARDGFEADKQDIIVLDLLSKKKINLTKDLDMTVDGSLYWHPTGHQIFYTASIKGTKQLFFAPLTIPARSKTWNDYKITSGMHDLNDIYGHYNDQLIISKTDMNTASELYFVENAQGKISSITEVNKDLNKSIKQSRTELRMVKTTDGKSMGVWVVYPPDFDPNKKYPALLYCQGGPQGALSQFYSFRWNFQLMAAQGYIVIAPNRRGMPGWGVEWNESISGDWGGQAMRDYMSASDALAKEPFVDKNRIGVVGASYGGYSAFMLAGMHENRYKTFISHCGLFDMKSWYGTTEEIWFANWDLGGNYWQKDIPKGFSVFSPSSYIQNWNKPIMIIQGEKDYRVPIEQGLQAFQAAQLMGLKSKLVLFPDENHWVLKPHNAMVWQKEFFNWLKETL